MKTFLRLMTQKAIVLFTACTLIAGSHAIAQPTLSFKNYSLQSGTDRMPGAVYRFTNVKSGVDALVTLVASVNGATLDSVDQVSSGFQEGFQPLVGVPAHTNGYLVFHINFVVAGGNGNATIPVLTHTAIDIDGHQQTNDSLYEWEAVNMGNGSAMAYVGTTPAVAVTQQGQWITGKNIEGKEYAGIDTLAKNAMFSVTNTNVGQYQIRVGVDNRSDAQVSRQRSSYHKQMNYALNVLPVKLAFFTAQLNNSRVDLKWQTVTEVNLNYFVVEKSTDGVNFSEAGIVFSTGTGTEKSNYSLADNISNNQSGVLYYRLRSIDNDGKSELSEIRLIRTSKATANTITLLTYPNPASNELRITVPANWQNKKLVYEVVALNGQLMKKKEANNSSQTETVNISSLSPGMYMVRVSCEGQTAQQKIIKQ
jgi:Secretion system C-terminal sorting domain